MDMCNNAMRSLLTLLLLLTVFTAQSAEHYVRQGATGGGSGTDWTNAYPDLPDTLLRRDTYYIADGSYSSYTFNDAVSGTDLITIKKATAADHGTDIGWSAGMGDGQAEFTATFRFDTDYYTIDGVVGGGPTVWGQGSDDDGSSYGIRIVNNDLGGTKLVRLNSSDNITIKHVDMSYDATDALPYPSPAGTSSQDAIYNISPVSDLTISFCRINSAGRTALLSRSNWSNITIEYTYFRDNVKAAHSGMHGEIWSANHTSAGAISNVTFRYNYIRNSRSTGGLIISGGDGIYIYGNVWYLADGSNGLISNWSAEQTSVNVFVYNNTFIGSDVGIGWSSMAVTSRNNAFYNNSDIDFSGGTHDYSYSDVSLGEANEQVFTGNPFLDTTGPAIVAHLIGPTMNAGLVLSTPYDVDMDGVTRGADGIWDRGAHEQVGGAIVRPVAPTSFAAN